MLDAGQKFQGFTAFQKTGAGTWTLDNSTTAVTPWTVAGGTLVVTSDAALGATSSALTLAGGTLATSAGFSTARAVTLGTGGGTVSTATGTTLALGGALSGTGSFTKAGAGTLQLTGDNSTFNGATIVDGGTLEISGGNSLSDTQRATIGLNGTLSLTGGSETLGSLAGDGAVSLGYRLTAGGDGTSSEFTGVISSTGSNGIVKTGSGTMTLSGVNTYTGSTTISQGTLALSDIGSIANSAGVFVDMGATLDVSGIAALSEAVIKELKDGSSGGGTVTLGDRALRINQASDQSFSGIFRDGSSGSGSGQFTKSGAGKLTLTGDSSAYTGLSTVETGTLSIGTGGVLGGGVTVLQNATLAGAGGSVAGEVTIQSGGILSGAAASALHAGTLTLADGAITNVTFGAPDPTPLFTADNLTVDGTLNVSGTPSYGAGVYRVFSSTNALTDNGLALGDTPSGAFGATLQVGTSTVDVEVAAFDTSLQYWSPGGGMSRGGSGTWDSSTAWLNNDATRSAWAGDLGVFAGAAGTVTVNGTQSIGTLEFMTSGYEVVAGTLGKLDLGADGGRLWAEGAAVTATVSTEITGTGALTKIGAGTVILSGANTYQGGTVIEAGTLQIASNTALGNVSGGVTFDGGTLALTDAMTIDRAITVDAGGGVLTLVAGETALVRGGISGTGTFTTGGLGTLNFGGDTSSFTGALVVREGVMGLNASATFANASSVTVNGTLSMGSLGASGTTFHNLSGGVGGQIVLGSKALTVVQNAADTFAGVISGTGALVKDGADLLVLAGTNTYTGGTTIAAGTLQIGAGGTSGSINGDAANSGTLAFNRSDAASFSGAISGSGQLVQLGSGTLTLTSSNSYTGGTTIAAGTLQLGNGSTSGSITGNVANNGTLAFNRSDALSFTGAVSGSGSLIQLGTGTLTLTGTNSYSGGTTITAGTLAGSATSFGSGAILNNAALVIDQPTDAVFANAIDGAGSFTKRGTGSLNLTGTSGLSGPTTVAAGRLAVNGSLANSSVTVQDGATLGGNGTLGATTILSGGTISPGNSIGTLTINGDLVLAPGSTYVAEIAGNGTSDSIVVNGMATVTGSQVAFTALDPQTSYQRGQRYTLLSAAGGVNGAFTRATTSSAFLDVALDPRTGEVDLVIAVKGSDPGMPLVTPTDPGTPLAVFQTVAQTRNQLSTALALNTLPQVGGTLALYNSLLMLDAGSARTAFNQLSGEVHASAKTALVEESSALRSAALDRLRSAFGSVGAAPMATMN
ncbi:hypothetical protein DWF00_14190, partial [Bosea caraganae]